MRNNYLFKKKDYDDEFSNKNEIDILLVDEAHEHNTYMDLILTLSKFAIYINNQVTLGIISATMESDEFKYRKYFEIIDDNWINPLNNNYEYNKNLNFDKNLLDRRLHLSVPFENTNYTITQMRNFIGRKEIDIVQDILKNTQTGDILIFEPGEAEIKKLVIEINNSTPSNIIAIPFYKNIASDIKDDIIGEIDKQHIRNNFHLPKNRDINLYHNISNGEKEKPNTYSRFIIVATNIAEASITIESLKYVIDTGTQKKSIYNQQKNQKILTQTFIAKSNMTQRKGRVGRKSPGWVYFTYNPDELQEKAVYEITISDIKNHILSLITTTNEQYLTPTYLNEISNDKFSFLKKQYFVLNKLYGNEIKSKELTISYPYSDGRYDLNTLIDEDGKFYIIHPNQDKFILNDESMLIDKTKDYNNTIRLIIDYFIGIKIIANNKTSDFGTLVLNLLKYLVMESFEIALLILNMLSFGYNFNDNNSNEELIKNILLFICFGPNTKTNITIKIPSQFKTKIDFLLKTSVIPNEYLNMIKLEHITKQIDELLEPKIKSTKINNYEINNNEIDSDEINDEKNNVKVKFIENIDKFTQTEIAKTKNEFIKNNESKLMNLFSNNENSYKSCIASVSQIFNIFYTIKIKMQILTSKYINNESFIKEMKKNYGEIKFTNNLNENMTLINNVKSLNNNEKMCYFIVNNFKNNLLIKIPTQPIYTTFYNRNAKSLYKISSYESFGKTKKITNLKDDYLNYIIFYVNYDDEENDYTTVTNLIYINKNSIININQPIMTDNNLPENFMQILKSM